MKEFISIINDLKIFLEDREKSKNEEMLKRILNELNILGRILNEYIKTEYIKLKNIFKELKKIDTYFKGMFEIDELILEIRLKEQKIVRICDEILNVDKLVKNLRFWEYKLSLEIVKENNSKSSYTLIIYYNLDKFNIYMIENLLKSVMNLKIFKEKIIPRYLENIEKMINSLKKDPLIEEVFLSLVENRLSG